MGRDMGHGREYSEEVASAIDEEVRAFIDVAHHEAYEILAENRDVLDALVVELLEKETLNREEIERIFEPLKRRPGRPAWTGSARRSPSDRPPVDVPPLANTNAFGPNAPTKASEAVEVEPVVAESVEAETETTKAKSVKSKGAKSPQADA
jgi:cell division protease FtsH